MDPNHPMNTIYRLLRRTRPFVRQCPRAARRPQPPPKPLRGVSTFKDTPVLPNPRWDAWLGRSDAWLEAFRRRAGGGTRPSPYADIPAAEDYQRSRLAHTPLGTYSQYAPRHVQASTNQSEQLVGSPIGQPEAVCPPIRTSQGSPDQPYGTYWATPPPDATSPRERWAGFEPWSRIPQYLRLRDVIVILGLLGLAWLFVGCGSTLTSPSTPIASPGASSPASGPSQAQVPSSTSHVPVEVHLLTRTAQQPLLGTITGTLGTWTTDQTGLVIVQAETGWACLRAASPGFTAFEACGDLTPLAPTGPERWTFYLAPEDD